MAIIIIWHGRRCWDSCGTPPRWDIRIQKSTKLIGVLNSQAALLLVYDRALMEGESCPSPQETSKVSRRNTHNKGFEQGHQACRSTTGYGILPRQSVLAEEVSANFFSPTIRTDQKRDPQTFPVCYLPNRFPRKCHKPFLRSGERMIVYICAQGIRKGSPT